MVKKRIPSFYLLLLLFFLCACSIEEKESNINYDCTPSFDNNNSLHPNNIELDALITKYKNSGLPAISMLVHDPIDGFWIGAKGKADLASNTDVKTCSLFRLASITKIFMGAIFSKLDEQQILSIDSLAADYLPDDIVSNIDNLDQVTIRQLLRHQSGIYNYTDSNAYGLDLINSMGHTNKALNAYDMLKYVYDKDSYFAPGTGYKYSNTGFLLLGIILSNVTNLSIEEALTTRIFSRLDLHNTYFNENKPNPEGLVQGYLDLHGDGNIRKSTNTRLAPTTTDGGIISNVYDLYKFSNELFENNYLSTDALAQMLDTGADTEKNVIQHNYGLGIDVDHNAYGHDGYRWDGGRTILYYYPEKKTTIIILSNLAEGKSNRLFYGLYNDVTSLLNLF